MSDVIIFVVFFMLGAFLQTHECGIFTWKFWSIIIPCALLAAFAKEYFS